MKTKTNMGVKPCYKGGMRSGDVKTALFFWKKKMLAFVMKIIA